MNENRTHPRTALHAEIWLGQDGIFARAQEPLTANLSEGGAFFETADGFPIGSVLNLRFMLPGARRLISCAASVRNLRHGGAGLGVQFLDMSPDDRCLVGAFVSDGGSGSSRDLASATATPAFAQKSAKSAKSVARATRVARSSKGGRRAEDETRGKGRVAGTVSHRLRVVKS